MRFKEYHDEWKNYTFNDLADYKKGPFGSALKKEIFVPKSINTIKVYEQQNVINKNWELERYYISSDYYQKMKSFTVYPNDILVSCAGTIGEIYILPEEAEIGIINQALMIMREKEIINKKFFLYIFENMIDSFSAKYSNGSAIRNIPPFSDLKKTHTYVPLMNEQLKIIGLLDKIEERIQTQIKIIEDYEILITSIENRLFWKDSNLMRKYKLSELLIERKNKSTVQNQFPVLSSTKKGVFLQSEYFNKEAASSNNIGYKITKLGDMIVSPQNLWMGNISYNDKFDNGLVSPSYFVYEINKHFNPIYISRLLKTKRALFMYTTISEQGASIVRRNLNIDSFNNLLFPIPDIKKQDEVGLFLHKLHQLIQIEHNILFQYQDQKKYLLNNLFI